MMDGLIGITKGLGLAAVSVLALVSLAYSTQVLIRILRHWNIKDPPPNLSKGKVGPFEFEIAADVTTKTADLTQDHEKRLQQIDGVLLRLIARVVELERGPRQIGGPKT